MRLVADLHIHSIGSGHAYSTVTEIFQAAKLKGLEMIAITDHGPAMPGGPHPYYFGNQRVLPEEIDGVWVLKGVEANIIDIAGNLDLGQEYLARLDIVLAGFHHACYPAATKKEYTQALLNTLNNQYVDVIVHPGNPEFAVDYEIIVEEAARLGLALEINNSSLCGSRRGSPPYCHQIGGLIARSGGPVFVGSDAHFARDVGRFEKALELINETGIREEQVVNTSVDKIRDYLAKRRSLRNNGGGPK